MLTRVPRPAVLALAALALLQGVALAVPAAAPAAADAASTGTADAFVVIAIVDSGINPYHRAFHGSTYLRNVDADATNDVDFYAHPSTYIAGFPASAPSLDLTINATTYLAGRNADLATYDAMAEDKLYWIPGTKIIGAYDGGGSFLLDVDDIHLLDENGHGTGTASLAAGNVATVQTLCRECLIVAVEGSAGYEWAIRQPWIDIVSNSYGARGNVGVPTPAAIGGPGSDSSREEAEKGKTILFASGNGAEGSFVVPVTTYQSNTVGPSWFVRVGAVTACTSPSQSTCGYPIHAAGKPADIVGPGSGSIPAAAHDHVLGQQQFSGTSAATPIAAGLFGNTLLTARKALGDAGVGPQGAQVLASGAPLTGTTHPTPLADGKLTRGELWETVFRAAEPPVNGSIYPLLPVKDYPGAYLEYGWGVANGPAKALAAKAVLGEAPLPTKDDMRRLALVDKVVQEELHGRWDRNGDGIRDSYRNDLVAEGVALLDSLP